MLLLAASANAAVTGTVIDQNGKPIAGAAVRAWAAEPSRVYRQRLLSSQPENDPIATATTNDAGGFSIDTKGTLAVDLRVDKEGRRSASIEAIDGDEPLTVILRPPVQRKVTVEGGGEPVANALVVFGPHLMARTNAAGEAPMLDESIAAAFAPDRAISVRPSPRIAPVMKVKLERGIKLSGHVLNAKGAGVKANLFIAGMPVGSSGDDGAFTIAHAPSNWPSLRVVAGKDVAFASHTEARTLELHVGPAMNISGALRDEAGRAVAGGRVTLRPQGPEEGEGFESAIADAKGNFAFDPLPPRSYSVFASHPAYSFDTLNLPAGEASNRLIVARALVRVRGRVVDEQGKPVAGAFVSNGGFGGRPNAVTDQAGAFSLRVAPPPGFQMFVLTAVKQGYATGASPRRKLKSGDVVEDVIIKMPAGFPLQVRVVDVKRQPVQGVSVSANSADDDSARAFVSCEDPFEQDCRVTDAKGTINLRLTEGQYAFNVSPAGDESHIAPRRIAAQQITAKSSPLVIEVENGVAIRGKVAYSDGTAVPDVTVEIRGGAVGNRGEQSNDGTIDITGLAAGKYTLFATTNDGHMTTPSVDVTAPASNVVLTMPRGGRIEGRVTDRGSGRPITDFSANVPVRGMSMRGRPRDVHSEDGSFVIENVPPGPTTVVISARGYVNGTRGDVQVEEGRATTGIDIQLDRGARLTGRVTAEGKALPDVSVGFTTMTGPMSGGQPRGVTDADGQYTLEGLPPGQPTVEFRKQGYAVKRQNIEISGSKDAHLDVELDRGRDLRGRVVDKSGAAVEGATINVSPAMMAGESQQAVTGADGGFVIEGLGETHYALQARKNGYVSANERDVPLPQSAPLVVTLDRGGTVTGRVTGLSPSELGSVYVYLSGGNSYASAQTDSTGAFTLRGVPDGRLSAQANIVGTDRRSRPKQFVVENGSAPPLEINFDEGFTVRGRVTFNGVPAANGYINFRAKDGGVGGRVSAGAYEVSGLAAGDYDVIMTSPDGGYRGKYTVTGSGTFDIDIRGATLRGHVVDAQSGQPVAQAAISLAGKAMTSFSNATSDSDGRFAVPALLDGTYTMSVHRETYSPATQTVEISNGSAPDVEVRLEGGTAVTIVVFDTMTGTALPMANVMIDDHGKRIAGGLARGEDGTRVWLRPGNYAALATAYPYATSPKVEFSVPGPTVRVGLTKGGALVVVARSAGRARLTNSTTAFVVPGGAITAGVARPISFVAGANPPIDGLTPGAYTLDLLDDKNAVVKRLPVTIVPGQTTTVTVD